MCRTAGLFFSGPGVQCFWGKKEKKKNDWTEFCREPPMWNVVKNNRHNNLVKKKEMQLEEIKC